MGHIWQGAQVVHRFCSGAAQAVLRRCTGRPAHPAQTLRRSCAHPVHTLRKPCATLRSPCTLIKKKLCHLMRIDSFDLYDEAYVEFILIT